MPDLDFFKKGACYGVRPEELHPEPPKTGKGYKDGVKCNLDILEKAAAERFCLSTGCKVRQICLDYALNRNENYGVWGGTTSEERRLIKRSIRLTKQAP